MSRMKIPGLLPASKAWRRRNNRLRREADKPDLSNAATAGQYDPEDSDYFGGYYGGDGMEWPGLNAITGVLGKIRGKGKGSAATFWHCDHWRTPVKMGVGGGPRYTVLASGLSGCPR